MATFANATEFTNKPSVFTAIANGFAAFGKALQRSAMRRALNELTDSELETLGLTRNQIEARAAALI